MCGSYKLASLIHEPLLNPAPGEDEIFAENVTYADPSVCFYLSNSINVCLM